MDDHAQPIAQRKLFKIDHKLVLNFAPKVMEKGKGSGVLEEWKCGD
jgi:hypothetical protein